MELGKPKSRFTPCLSQSQRNSLRLLLEWWDADYQPHDTIATAKAVISMHARSEVFEERVPSDFNLLASHYHKKLFDLLLYEFFFYGRGTAAPIQLRRHNASLAAACQRLAFPLVRASVTKTLRPLSERYPGLDAAMNDSWADRPIGAIIEACPKAQKQGAPYFLWDIEAERTVQVHELPQTPKYCVVSHTWGRWRLQGGQCRLPGVPWEVPTNTRFSVQDLPTTLRTHSSVFLPATHVWFDLLCIPQDGSELGDREIARQAAIFGGATKAMIWLNDIVDWKGIRAGVACLALRYLISSSTDVSERAESTAEILKDADSPTHLFKSFEHENSERGAGSDPSGWFTSLWTLQESFLRPEMTLHNRDWTPLQLQSAPASPHVTLDSILALIDFDKSNSTLEYDHEVPSAANEVCALVHHVRFDSLLDYSPLTALILASRRQCTGRRAEAIMSVFGATKWFGEASPAQREENLVFDSYPIAFLREVQTILGINLFCSWYIDCCYWDIFQTTGEGEIEVVPAGTLLPIDRFRLGSKYISHVSSSDVFDHASTRTWRLSDQGTVCLPEAAIVTSTEERDVDASAVATITCPSKPGSELDTLYDEDLRDVLSRVFVGVPKYAICLQYRENGWSRGVILMGVFDNEEPARTFAKLGDYYTNPTAGFVKSEARPVDWEVL